MAAKWYADFDVAAETASIPKEQLYFPKRQTDLNLPCHDNYMHEFYERYFGLEASTLDQAMACRPVGARPLPIIYLTNNNTI